MRALTVSTKRLATHLLTEGPADGQPLLFLHGNVSSSRFWEETLAALPPGTRALAPDLRGFGGDYREDVVADCGHSPHVERPEESRRLLWAFLRQT